ncbi:MAG: glycoside hydrolase family 25 protein [Chthoniobacterales bacterium]
MINTIIDIYHQNDVDLKAAKEGGIIAVIHKATQGATIRDSTYHQRRERAKALGLLWGAYHFSTGGSVTEQVENFLHYAQPGDDELISLDWEPSDGPDMTLDQARHFVQMIKDETGRWPVVYGGSLLRESIDHQPDAVLSNCPLWYARYANAPVGIPTQVWPSYTLWQYTDGDVGPQPYGTPGAGGGVDRNIFQGSAQQLKAQWPLTRREEGAAPGAGFAAIVNAASPQPSAKKKRGAKRKNARR